MCMFKGGGWLGEGGGGLVGNARGGEKTAAINLFLQTVFTEDSNKKHTPTHSLTAVEQGMTV